MRRGRAAPFHASPASIGTPGRQAGAGEHHSLHQSTTPQKGTCAPRARQAPALTLTLPRPRLRVPAGRRAVATRGGVEQARRRRAQRNPWYPAPISQPHPPPKSPRQGRRTHPMRPRATPLLSHLPVSILSLLSIQVPLFLLLPSSGALVLCVSPFFCLSSVSSSPSASSALNHGTPRAAAHLTEFLHTVLIPC